MISYVSQALLPTYHFHSSPDGMPERASLWLRRKIAITTRIIIQGGIIATTTLVALANLSKIPAIVLTVAKGFALTHSIFSLIPVVPLLLPPALLFGAGIIVKKNIQKIYHQLQNKQAFRNIKKTLVKTSNSSMFGICNYIVMTVNVIALVTLGCGAIAMAATAIFLLSSLACYSLIYFSNPRKSETPLESVFVDLKEKSNEEILDSTFNQIHCGQKIVLNLTNSPIFDETLFILTSRLFAKEYQTKEHLFDLTGCQNLTFSGLKKLLKEWPFLELILTHTSFTKEDIHYLQADFPEATLMCNHVSTDMEKFYMAGTACDITFRVDNIFIPAHRLIFAAFGKQFNEADYAKDKNNLPVIDVKSISLAEFKQILSEIYLTRLTLPSQEKLKRIKVQNDLLSGEFQSNFYEKLFANPLYSDFQVKVVNEERKILEVIHVHKAVLMARSPHFYNELTSEFSEKQKGELLISLSQRDLYHSVLEFIYTSKKPTISSDKIEKFLNEAIPFLLEDLNPLLELQLIKDNFKKLDEKTAQDTIQDAMKSDLLILANRCNSYFSENESFFINLKFGRSQITKVVLLDSPSYFLKKAWGSHIRHLTLLNCGRDPIDWLISLISKQPLFELKLKKHATLSLYDAYHITTLCPNLRWRGIQIDNFVPINYHTYPLPKKMIKKIVSQCGNLEIFSLDCAFHMDLASIQFPPNTRVKKLVIKQEVRGEDLSSLFELPGLERIEAPVSQHKKIPVSLIRTLANPNVKTVSNQSASFSRYLFEALMYDPELRNIHEKTETNWYSGTIFQNENVEIFKKVRACNLDNIQWISAQFFNKLKNLRTLISTNPLKNLQTLFNKPSRLQSLTMNVSTMTREVVFQILEKCPCLKNLTLIKCSQELRLQIKQTYPRVTITIG